MGMVLAIEGRAGTGGALPPDLGPDGTLIVDNRLSLGSAPENDLVLDSAIPVHCLIFNDRGRYQLLDHSNGGITMNDAPGPLAGDGPVPLNIGDSLVIGDYRLTVLGDAQPEAETAPPSRPEDSRADEGADEPVLLDRVEMEPSGADYAVRRDDGMPPWDDAEGALFAAPAGASQFDHADPLTIAYEAPRNGRNIIPDDWDLLAEIPGATARPADRPPAATERAGPVPAPGPADDTLMRAFCRGLGLRPADLPADQDAQTLELAGGLLAAALAEIRALLTDHATTRPVAGRTGGQTNPLRLPGTAGETLQLLMRGTLPGLLPGDLAISDACAAIAAERDDLRHRLHEVSDMAVEMLSPEAIAAAIEPPGLSQRLRRLRGGPDPFRSAFERRHREIALGIGVLSGRLAQGDPAASRHGERS